MFDLFWSIAVLVLPESSDSQIDKQDGSQTGGDGAGVNGTVNYH